MPYFDRFDICEAYYLFAYGYHHGGDTSDGIFNRLHRLRFKPHCSLACSDIPMMGLTENGAEIYNQLIVSHPDSHGINPEFLEIVEE